MRLHRSRTAPLHVRVDGDFRLDEKRGFYDLLRDYYTRIASLHMLWGNQSVFGGRAFPRLRLLDVKHWTPVHSKSEWGTMPELRSLRLRSMNFSVVPSNDLASLKVLILSNTDHISLPRHSPSLTTLMLDDISLVDTISGPMSFPSLTYLSLYNARGLKPYVNAPYLVTYHEGGSNVGESFSAPLHSLVEYGVYGLNSKYSDPTKWHHSFPNISRVFIRADPPVLNPFLDSLSGPSKPLPALRMISAGIVRTGFRPFTEAHQEIVDNFTEVRSEGRRLGITLCFEAGPPFEIPIFFGKVCSCLIR